MCRGRGRAGGGDGWTGTEIADMIPAVHKWVSRALHKFGLLKVSPSSWGLLRQVMLPKDSGIGTSAVCDASRLRPISIGSMWWRVYAAAIVNGDQVQQ